MFIFGTGSRLKKFGNVQNQVLIAKLDYFHIFWCPITYRTTWHLVGENRSEDRVITRDEAEQLFPNDPPKIDLWNRFGLVFVVTGIMIISFFF